MIPVCEPELSSVERKNLMECYDSGWISSNGKYVKTFEDAFSKYIGCEYGIAVSNGTTALEAAIFALEIKPGDEIILPSFTIVSCVIAIIRQGGIPVFTDVDKDTWCITASEIKKRLSNKTKAVMVVHMFGHPADMKPILELSNKYGFLVIEDASQVHGAEYFGKKCGSLGHISTFSFYANKIITTSEGGMVITSNKKYADLAASFRNLCFRKTRDFIHDDFGHNFRLTSLQASIGIAQLSRIEYFLKQKIKNGKIYKKYLSKIPGIQIQTERKNIKSVYWMYSIVLNPKSKIFAKDVVTKLSELGIGSRMFFSPLHKLPAFKKRNLMFKAEGSFNQCERLSKYGLYLPSSISIKEKDIKIVCEKVKEILS